VFRVVRVGVVSTRLWCPRAVFLPWPLGFVNGSDCSLVGAPICSSSTGTEELRRVVPSVSAGDADARLLADLAAACCLIECAPIEAFSGWLRRYQQREEEGALLADVKYMALVSIPARSAGTTLMETLDALLSYLWVPLLGANLLNGPQLSATVKSACLEVVPWPFVVATDMETMLPHFSVR
jgi:hypothetical protein